MLSTVLNSDRAIEVNIAIMRTFVLIREHALNYKEPHEKLKELEQQYNRNCKAIYQAFNPLIAGKAQQEEMKRRERIGFKIKSST